MRKGAPLTPRRYGVTELHLALPESTDVGEDAAAQRWLPGVGRLVAGSDAHRTLPPPPCDRRLKRLDQIRWRRSRSDLAALLCVFLGLPLVELMQGALIAGGLWEAMRRPIVFEAVRFSTLTTAAVLLLIFGSPLALARDER